MHSKLRCPSKGTIVTILMIILILMIMGFTIFDIYSENMELKEKYNLFNQTINTQSNTIKELKLNNDSLNAQITSLQEEKQALIEEKELLIEEKNQLEKDKTLLQEEINKETILVQPTNNDFKSYMPYTAITNKSSKQWELQQFATTDENGLRCIDGIPMVAVGTGWGINVGDTALVVCENGNNFEVIIGDIKDNVHTTSDNKTTISNGCRCEFIVDMNSLNTTVKNIGNVAVLERYNGYITSIVKI